ncbi:hypothetical protein [Aliikangiella maris]|uniref:DUF2147 domain-containing protein n=2 Tax=Aliikangiella maris TaxID=3162458 RepID=A0ABV2BTD9_9GAMM
MKKEIQNGKEQTEMERLSPSILTPGDYQFRPNPFVPWIDVKVFKESSNEDSGLLVNWAGEIIDADKLVNRGEWKPIQKQRSKP